MTRTALVLGGGIAGLASAIALRDAGYTVALYEQAERIAPVGAALSLWPNAMAALRRLGAAAAIEAEAAPITAMLLAGQDGRPLIGPNAVADAYLPTRTLLQRALTTALGDVPVHLGCRAARVDPDGEVAFADGEVRRADLIVAADGLWSPTGDALLGNPARPRGYRGVLALSDVVTGPSLDGLAAEYWGRGERFGVFDLGDGRRYWFYMQRDGAALPDRDALLDKAAGWPAGVAAAVAATPADRLIPVSIAARSVPRRLGRGRVICVGDAAHGMEPNLGQGACQALEDAAVLGACARSVAPEALAAAFTRIRQPRVAGLMRRSTEGGWAAHGPRPVQVATRAAMRLLPAAWHRRVMAGFHQPSPW